MNFWKGKGDDNYIISPKFILYRCCCMDYKYQGYCKALYLFNGYFRFHWHIGGVSISDHMAVGTPKIIRGFRMRNSRIFGKEIKLPFVRYGNV